MNAEPEDAGRTASAEWPARLRKLLVQVARRRVAPDAVEDVVQDALRIIVERGIRRPGDLAPGGEPGLAHSFQVLRNVIGNHYQKERTRRRRLAVVPPGGYDVADPAPEPLGALAAEAAAAAVHDCLDLMSRTDAACARYLRGLADGRTPGELAREESVDEPALYRRLYRCRLKLRALLAERGLFA
jgi:DNA-directed RNA polymerase specialized sigma24 family protein